MYDVIVIGAGLAGTLSALELAKKYKVLLLEAGEDVIPTISSSYNECYKLHTGMHYIGDKQTARQCLINAIEFAKRFRNFIAGGTNLFSPCRRGRHYIMENSMVSVEEAKNIALYLQDVYKKLIEQNPDNKVFGEPENFIKFLEKEDYNYISDSIPYYDRNGEESQTSVVFGIETAESQIDIETLRVHLQQEIEKNPNITFVPLARVTDFAHRIDQFGYIVSVLKEGETRSFAAKMLVNCSWQNIEKLDNTMGSYSLDTNRVNRIKASILVKLEKPLRHMNTCIFSSGPYCSITVLPDGHAILTSERITNVGFYNANSTSVPRPIQEQLLSELRLDHEKGQQLAQQILVDCASYMKDDVKQHFLQAEIQNIHVGFVKLMNISEQYDQKSIHRKSSVIHARQLDGVEHKGLGHISNSGMKMTYTAGNATKVSSLVDKDFDLIQSLTTLIDLTKKCLSKNIKDSYGKIIAPLLHITYRERMLKLVSSLHGKPSEEDFVDWAKLIADEITNYLEIKSDVLSMVTGRFFSKKSIDESISQGIGKTLH